MSGIVKCVAVAVILLALLGMAACGGREAAPPAWAKFAPEQITEAKTHGVPLKFENDLGMRFVLIPAGTFVMGSPEDEEGREWNETQREVAISQPFYMQVTEVTNGQYRRWKQRHDSGESEGHTLNRDKQPAVNASWDDATAFAEWLSGQDPSRAYALPREAQWEYACRGDTSAPFSFGENITAEQAKCFPSPWDASGISRWEDFQWGSADVATLGRNTWGLYDMHGNVCEWCQDAWRRPRENRVARGGSWRFGVRWARSATRLLTVAPFRAGYFGFRLVSPLPEPKSGK